METNERLRFGYLTGNNILKIPLVQLPYKLAWTSINVIIPTCQRLFLFSTSVIFYNFFRDFEIFSPFFFCKKIELWSLIAGKIIH